MSLWDWIFGTTPAPTPEPGMPAMIPESMVSSPVLGLKGTLRDFQHQGVMYAANKKSVFIGDDMGTGKSIQALATIEHLGAYPALIICPSFLKYNWEAEAGAWVDKTVQVISGTKKIAFTADIIVINYDILRSHSKNLHNHGFKSIVSDESHLIKNVSSQRSNISRSIARSIPVRLCLSGTPVINHPDELKAQLMFLDRFTEIGNRPGGFSGLCANPEELHRVLKETCFIRRRKSDVLPELPAKQRTFVPLEITNRKQYEMAMVDVVGWVQHNTADTGEFKLKAKARFDDLKKLCAIGKLNACEDWIRNTIAQEPLVLFAYHVDIQDELCRRFPEALHIMGSDSDKARFETVKAFQAGKSNLIICSIKAAGVGLTLTRAKSVAFLELGWTPAEMWQAEDRLARIGQTRGVNCYYLLGRQTVDQRIMSLLQRKENVVSRATDGQATQSILDSLIQELGRAA